MADERLRGLEAVDAGRLVGPAVVVEPGETALAVTPVPARSAASDR